MTKLVTPRNWVKIIALIGLLAYISLLVLLFHNSQNKLRQDADLVLKRANSQSASLIRHFLDEEIEFSEKISESPEIRNYLSNVGLGVSMKYGLSQSIYEIEEMLKNVISKKKIFGEPIYDRIIFIDENKKVIADTEKSENPSAIPEIDHSSKNTILSISDTHVTRAAPVTSGGVYSGIIISTSPLQVLQNYLKSIQPNTGPDQILIRNTGEIISGYTAKNGIDYKNLQNFNLVPSDVVTNLESLNSSTGNGKFPSGILAYRAIIPGTDLSLVSTVKSSVLYERTTAQINLALTAMAPLLLALLSGMYYWLKSRDQRMKSMVAEATQKQVHLLGENEDLNNEIIRRISIENELRASEERYRMYIDHAPEGVVVFDNHGCIIDSNGAINEMLHCNSGSLIGKYIQDILLDDKSNFFATVNNELITSKTYEIHTGLKTFNDEALLVDLKFVSLPGERTICFCVDVTEKKKSEERINNLAYFDPLTSLPNRRLLIDRLQQALLRIRRNGKRCAIMMLDLDNFKTLNDTMGHDVGDLLLCAVGRRLTDSVREQDTVARLGGDEFIILLDGLIDDDVDIYNQINSIALKINMLLSQPYELVAGKTEYSCGCSIGISISSNVDTTVELLIKQADVALYDAKNSGRNNFKIFTPEMQAIIDSRARIENSLRKALSKRELQLFCQGQSNANGEIIGGELLLRWMSDEGQSSVPPSVFIPLAEEAGLITEVGNWVLHQACEILEQWQHNPKTSSLTLAVNISGIHFHEPDFVDAVIVLLKNYTFPQKKLKIELTESVVIRNVDLVAKKMSALKDAGVLFSLDDFGTGYSSLSYLKSLPIDEIKIDKSFVRDISTDPNDAAIVRAIVAMSQSLGFSVIAEGVETTDQKSFLLNIGCRKMQGYLYSKPTQISDFINHHIENKLYA